MWEVAGWIFFFVWCMAVFSGTILLTRECVRYAFSVDEIAELKRAAIKRELQQEEKYRIVGKGRQVNYVSLLSNECK